MPCLHNVSPAMSPQGQTKSWWQHIDTVYSCVSEPSQRVCVQTFFAACSEAFPQSDDSRILLPHSANMQQFMLKAW